MKRMMASAAIVLAALAGCNGGKPEGGSGQASAAAAATGGSWNVLDACAKLDKAIVEQSLGGTVQSAELSAVHDGENGGDRYSQCVYSFGGLDIFVFGTGESAGGTAAELAESMRSQIKQGSDTPTVNVPGVGEAAIWNDGLHQLYVFVGDHRFLSFAMGKMGGPIRKRGRRARAQAGRLRVRAIVALAALALTAAAPAPDAAWVLRGDGLSRSVAGKPQLLRFGASRQAAVTAASAVLGKPVSTQTSPDCGQGNPMVLVSYKNGLTLQFLAGKFSGWSLDPPADPRLRTVAGIAIGSTRTALLKAYPDATIDDGSLGVMFTREDGLSGFLDSDLPAAKVSGLYAGETCLIS